MSLICEMLMIISFGISWPVSAVKSYQARTAKGQSLFFMFLIFAGYIAGIISKLTSEAYMAEISSKWYVLFFYVFNLIVVVINMLIYIRNVKLDKEENK